MTEGQRRIREMLLELLQEQELLNLRLSDIQKKIDFWQEMLRTTERKVGTLVDVKG